MAKSWQEKLNSNKPSEKKTIDKAFAGMPAGALMYITTPLEVDAYIRKLKSGQWISAKQMREAIAAENDAEYTCPVSTGIFLRIVAEAAHEQLQQGRSINEICPFWRVISRRDKLAAKLSFAPDFLLRQQELEGITTE